MEPDLFSENNIRKINSYEESKKLIDDITANYHLGNPQSVQANKIAHKGKVNARQRILDMLDANNIGSGHGIGLICEEIETFTGLSHQTCSARLSELRREGKIKIVGTRKTRSGSPASVYQST